MHVRLLYPPFADPTQPYGALPALKGYLRAGARQAEVIDLNVEAAHFLLAPRHIAATAGRLAERFSRLNGRPRLTGLEQMEYLALEQARQAALRGSMAAAGPLQIFQQARRFFDRREYRHARDRAEDALTCLSALYFPFAFSFNRAAHAAAPWNLSLLETYFDQRCSPLDAFYRDRIERWRLQPGDVVGISLTFVSQLPETFYLLRLLRRAAPNAFILLGGTCAQQILRHAPEAVRSNLFDLLDAACPFEGEACLTELLERLEATPPGESAERRFERLRTVPNLWLRNPGDGRRHAGPLQITDLTRCPPPDFSDLNLDRYLAPSRTLLVAPTRGCYWNRCSFCDYGLNRSGLHHYRETAPEEAARQLKSLSEAHGVTNFYLSVDVLAPKFAVALARALIAQKARIRWAADFRIEPYYTPERCALLFQSGLRAAAFGVESGSDRLLESMHKGISVDAIRRVTDAFHRAGIATAWMTFSGHPGETAGQLRATLRLLEAQQPAVDLFILGRFGLTGGAHIAACPEQYGIHSVFYCRGDDFRLFPLYDAPASMPPAEAEALEREILRLSAAYNLDHYPWAGAISTHHSLLYFLEYGQSAFRGPAPPAPPPTRRRRGPRRPGGLTERAAFDVGRMRREHRNRMQHFWRRALSLQKDGHAPLDAPYFLAEIAKWPPMKRQGGLKEE